MGFRKIMSDEKSKVALMSIVSNTLLVLLKLMAGLITNSVSIISEAIHSSLDLLAAIIAFASVRISSRPPDEKHQYGHGKFENLSGTIEALLIFIAAVWIIVEACDKLINKGTVETVTAGVAVMAVSAVTNTLISTYLMKTARKTHSVALEADALHLRTDVYTSIGVLVGLAALKITGIQILDPLIAIGVAALIIKTSFDLTVKAFRPLLDVALGQDDSSLIEDVILGMEDYPIVSYHKLRTRQSGPDRHLDMHLVVPRDLTVEAAHELAHEVEKRIKLVLPHSIILIHTEPCTDGFCSNCAKCPQGQYLGLDENTNN